MRDAPGDHPEESKFRYRRLRKYSILLTVLVSLTPLIIMTFINSHQYQKALRAEMTYPISRQTSNTRRSLEAFTAERRSALNLIIKEKSFEDLLDHENLTFTLRHLKESFGGFVDLGLIDAQGQQRSYVGPYDLEGKIYTDQDWFHEVQLKGVYVSDVFKGYRGFPHFVIAVMHEGSDRSFYILRATIDSDVLYHKILSQSMSPSTDAFLVNRSGILQTPSRFHGDILKKCALPIPPYSAKSEVLEEVDLDGKPYVLGYAYIENSPFILMEVIQPQFFMRSWLSVRNNLLFFLGISIVLILIVIIWGSYYMVGRIREADLKRVKALHQIEYTNKMASIGRLAAGVAHEINNPLAIIYENAGMLTDMITYGDNIPKQDKFLKHIKSIISSVDRCSAVTHRLLGFAKRMDPHIEQIEPEGLIKEVLGFLGKEALHRNIVVNVHAAEDLPAIQSDRGQLQQVFLNIINNAFAAIENSGQIDIAIEERGHDRLAVMITDNGKGIPKEELERIFEPFFTTKKEYGTGLGLSITYGIIKKLGGDIFVKSKVGVGTTFTVILPFQVSESGE
ncbi:MAG: ATP-binding protein [Candidatus Zixiibacteriota bacterium]|nr:MAG: ATP-binding protein [candidate division Zixibacteria bacterium]